MMLAFVILAMLFSLFAFLSNLFYGTRRWLTILWGIGLAANIAAVIVRLVS